MTFAARSRRIGLSNRWRRATPAGRVALFLGIVAPLAFLGWACTVSYDPRAFDYGDLSSVRVVARDGSPLRVTLGDAGTRAEWVALESISPRVVQATLAAEDRRFARHFGIDPLAVGRAVWTNVRAGHVVAGGSTITQQLAGLVWPEPRTWGGKLREAVRAVRIEIDLSKRDILAHYLNRLPYGPGTTGIAAASRRLCGREPVALSASQAATLAVLPRSPAVFARPEGRESLRQRRDAVLVAMARRGDLSAVELAAARGRDLEIEPEPAPFAAPHFADWVLATLPPAYQRATRLETTLDPRLQADVEGLVRAQLENLRGRGVREMAAVVLQVESGEVLAMVGSPSWESSQVNGALALRQPGSALKPFLYGMSFAAGMSPADVLADLPLAALDGAGGEVAPRNFDGRWHGPVRAREALASSFNVPAVRVQQRLGGERVLRGLREAGLGTLDADAAFYGLGLVLGVGEVRLLDLAAAYASLARGGVWSPPVGVRAASDARGTAIPVPPPVTHRWLDPASAFLVGDILSDDAARVAGFGASSVLDLPFAVAVKTGTSTDYRNSWCVGYTADYVVGVWAGNFDASPVRGLVGATGAGPVFREVMMVLRSRGGRPWRTEPPADWRREPVCGLSGEVPGPACGATQLEWFPPGAYARRSRCTYHVRDGGRTAVRWPAEYQEWARDRGLVTSSIDVAAARHPKILSPTDGSIYFRDPRLESSGIRFVAESPQSGDVWSLDGRPVPASFGGSPVWAPTPGRHRLQLFRGAARAEIDFVVR